MPWLPEGHADSFTVARKLCTSLDMWMHAGWSRHAGGLCKLPRGDQAAHIHCKRLSVRSLHAQLQRDPWHHMQRWHSPPVSLCARSCQGRADGLPNQQDRQPMHRLCVDSRCIGLGRHCRLNVAAKVAIHPLLVAVTCQQHLQRIGWKQC